MHRVEEFVRAVRDPELGHVTIGDLGLVRSVTLDANNHADVTLVPTFSGCPALHIIAADAQSAAIAGGATTAAVRFEHNVPWTTASISDSGRKALSELGIAVAADTGTTCPYCCSLELTQVSAVGPAACRSAWWCSSCRTVVDVFRDSATLPIPTRRTSHVHI